MPDDRESPQQPGPEGPERITVWGTIRGMMGRFADKLRGKLADPEPDRYQTIFSFMHRGNHMTVRYNPARSKLILSRMENGTSADTVWLMHFHGNFRASASDSGNYVCILTDDGMCKVLDSDNGALYQELSLGITPDDFSCMPTDEFIEVYKDGRRVTYSVESGRMVENVENQGSIQYRSRNQQ